MKFPVENVDIQITRHYELWEKGTVIYTTPDLNFAHYILSMNTLAELVEVTVLNNTCRTRKHIPTKVDSDAT